MQLNVFCFVWFVFFWDYGFNFFTWQQKEKQRYINRYPDFSRIVSAVDKLDISV